MQILASVASDTQSVAESTQTLFILRQFVSIFHNKTLENGTLFWKTFQKKFQEALDQDPKTTPETL